RDYFGGRITETCDGCGCYQIYVSIGRRCHGESTWVWRDAPDGPGDLGLAARSRECKKGFAARDRAWSETYRHGRRLRSGNGRALDCGSASSVSERTGHCDQGWHYSPRSETVGTERSPRVFVAMRR